MKRSCLDIVVDHLYLFGFLFLLALAALFVMFVCF